MSPHGLFASAGDAESCAQARWSKNEKRKQKDERKRKEETKRKKQIRVNKSRTGGTVQIVIR